MERRKGKNGSPAHASGGNRVKKQQIKGISRRKTKYDKSIITMCLLIIFDALCIAIVFWYSMSSNKIVVLTDNLSKLAWVILAEIVTVTVAYVIKEGKDFSLEKINKIIVIDLILVSICVFLFSTFFGIFTENKKGEDKDVILISATVGDTTNNNAPAYEIKRYIFNEDPFLENKEQYVEVSLEGLSEDEIDKYVEAIILDTVKTEKEEQTKIPQAYTDYITAADAHYKTYIFQLELIDKKHSSFVKQDLFETRINELNCSIDLNKKANTEYKNPETQRIIGLRYIDLADDCIRNGLELEAVDALEEASKWGMNSIRTKLANDDYDFDEAYKVLLDASNRMDKIEDIGNEHKENLQYVCKIYGSIKESQ